MDGLHIVPRPRLLALLDGSSAPVRLLVGTAGYGKTILAKQWLGQRGDRVVWFRADSSACDPAVFAESLARAIGELVPNAGSRLRRRLQSAPSGSPQPEVIGELLESDLDAWPSDAWLVIDDYHHISENSEAERLIETVMRRASVRLMVLAHERPAWVSSRDLMYGHVLEIDQKTLAMRPEEVADVLRAANNRVNAGLLRLAEQWPALVGLAASLGDSERDEGKSWERLSVFVEEEVIVHFSRDGIDFLRYFALVPEMPYSVITRVFGQTTATGALLTLERLGLGARGYGSVTLHPILEHYLRDHPSGSTRRRRATVSALRREGRWDVAINLAIALDDRRCAAELVTSGFADLIKSGRIGTARRAIEAASGAMVASPELTLCRAEVELIDGRHLSALMTAESVLCVSEASSNAVRYRAHLVAGRAAHFLDDESAAVRHFRSAVDVAPSRTDRREAQWGVAMALVALEDPEAIRLIDEMERGARYFDRADRLRLETRRLMCGLRFGRLTAEELRRARRVLELVKDTEDILARTSFLAVLATALANSGHYAESLYHANELLREAAEYRLVFALPYAHAVRASSCASLKDFDGAINDLETARRKADDLGDAFAIRDIYVARVLTMLKRGDAASAAIVPHPDCERALPHQAAEVWAARELALACAGQAPEPLQSKRSLSASAAPVVMWCLAEAVRAANDASENQFALASAALDVALESGFADAAVAAYRGSPAFLGAVLPDVRAEILLQSAADGDIFLSHRSVGTSDPRDVLTRREREICELIVEGLRNREIAARLFITTDTVKSHANRVFRKLGVRSRTALIAAARDWTRGY